MRGHNEVVTSAVAFSPDGARVVTASADNTARLWDAATGQTVAALEGHDRPGRRSAAFSPDGARVLTGSSDKTARLWPVFSSDQKLGRGGQSLRPALSDPGAARNSFHLGTPAAAMVLRAQTLALRRRRAAAGGLGRVAGGRVGSRGGLVRQGARAEMNSGRISLAENQNLC